MKFPKMPCQHQGDDKCPEAQDDRMPRSPHVESTDTGHQDVSHNQVEHPPQDVDR